MATQLRRIRRPKNKKLPIILTVVGILLAISVTTAAVFRDGFTKFPGPLTVTVKDGDKPKFVFDTAKFPDWASSGNVWHDSEDTNKDPIATIGMSQCAEGSNCSDLLEECRTKAEGGNQSCEELERHSADGCTVHAHYFSRPIDPDTVVSDELEQWSSFETIPQEIGVKTLNMTTPDGDKAYQLHQYDTNNSDQTYKRGSSFGFIPLNNGHIEVRSICQKASQLDDTLPILSIIRLEI